MTGKQIELMKKQLPSFFEREKWTKNIEIIYEELCCRDMINSCLCYGDNFFEKSYAPKYYKILGEKRVNEIYAEQEKDFREAILIKNSYTDSEGLTYNTIIWKDDDNYFRARA